MTQKNKAIICDKPKKLDIFNILGNFWCGRNSLIVPYGPFQSAKRPVSGLWLNTTVQPNET